MLERGQQPGHDDYGELLRACADEVKPDTALAAVAEMRAAGLTPTSDDHDAVLIAHMFLGRAPQAEAYLRSVPWDDVVPDHLRRVLWACLFSRRVDDAERLFEEFEASPVPPDDECRLVLLGVFMVGREAAKARSWFARFARPGEEPRPEFVARLIDVHGQPEYREVLTGLDERLTEEQRGDPGVATSLVHAYARADDPSRAEELLVAAIDVVANPVEREELFHVVVGAYRRLAEADASAGRTVDEALDRLRTLAEARDVTVDDL